MVIISVTLNPGMGNSVVLSVFVSLGTLGYLLHEFDVSMVTVWSVMPTNHVVLSLSFMRE